MSIQRWDDNGPSPFGMYVLFSDHVAAVAEAEQRVLDENVTRWREELRQSNAYERAAALDAARDAVIAYSEERIIKTGHPNMSEDITAALRVAAARIDALRGEQ